MENKSLAIDTKEAFKKAPKPATVQISEWQNETIFTTATTETLNIALKGDVGNRSPKKEHDLPSPYANYALYGNCLQFESIRFVYTYLPVLMHDLVNLTEHKYVF